MVFESPHLQSPNLHLSHIEIFIMTKTIPYTIIGGYLGAGKTTLLNNLLRNSSAGCGWPCWSTTSATSTLTPIWSSAARRRDDQPGQWLYLLQPGGRLFMQALARLRDQADRIDHIIVEASGVSDPVKIGQYGAILRYELDGVIVLARREIQGQSRQQICGRYGHPPVARRGSAGAQQGRSGDAGPVGCGACVAERRCAGHSHRGSDQR